MGNRAAYYGDCKSPYSAPADCKSAGTGASKATMKTLSLTSKVLGGAFVVVSEIPDLLIAWNDPSLGNVTKVVVGSVLGAATVFAGPVVATGAFVLGVVNAYGGFDEGYDYLNNMKTNNR